MIVEIVNPSDRAYMEAEERVVLVLANLILSDGLYGLREVGGDWSVSILGLGGDSLVDEYFEEEFGEGPGEALSGGRLAAVGEALASVRLARDPEDYERVKALSGDELEEAHDERRSSMNDFARRAWSISVGIRGASS